MYESYWNLSEKPFLQRIAPGRQYRSQSQQAASLRLKYCIDNGLGLGLLIGQAGTGKSSLLRSFSPTDYHPLVHVVFSLLDAPELLRVIASELKADLSTAALAAMTTDALLHSIRSSLRQNTSSGHHTLICIDDAHQLGDQVLTSVVQPLMNMSDIDDSIEMSLLLAGQPILSSRLRKHAQISDRIAVTAAVQGFTLTETTDYIRTAVAAAGGDPTIFSEAASARLFEVTGGNPRRLNRLADMALLVGYADQLRQINDAEIDAISHELMPAAA